MKRRIAAGGLALATLTVAAPALAETLRERMAKDPSIHLYTVEFRSDLDAHRKITGFQVVKVIDGATGRATRRVHVAPAFKAAARARVQQQLYLPHIHGQHGPAYNSFLYSPTYPDVLIIDPDRAIEDQTP
jgi:hypothetical protein